MTKKKQIETWRMAKESTYIRLSCPMCTKTQPWIYVKRKRSWPQDSNYFKLKGHNSDLAEQLKTYLRMDYCPLAPFLLERLFSVWVNYRGLNIKTL